MVKYMKILNKMKNIRNLYKTNCEFTNFKISNTNTVS